MSDNLTVVHVFDGTVCSTLDVNPSPWAAAKQSPNGTVVTCGLCGQMGVVPDPGHANEWMRAMGERQGATVTERDGVMTFTYGATSPPSPSSLSWSP